MAGGCAARRRASASSSCPQRASRGRLLRWRGGARFCREEGGETGHGTTNQPNCRAREGIQRREGRAGDESTRPTRSGRERGEENLRLANFTNRKALKPASPRWTRPRRQPPSKKKSRRLSQSTAEEVAAAAAPAASASRLFLLRQPCLLSRPCRPCRRRPPCPPAAFSLLSPEPGRANAAAALVVAILEATAARAAWPGRRTWATPRSTCGRRCSCSRRWRGVAAAGARRQPARVAAGGRGERGGGGGRRRACGCARCT